jgi:hypothetical protein
VQVSAHRKLALSVSASSSMQAEVSRMAKPVFPFVKITGQTDMKLGLILNIIDPSLGGVLIMGDRGTGKSMAVRASATGGCVICWTRGEGSSPPLCSACL